MNYNPVFLEYKPIFTNDEFDTLESIKSKEFFIKSYQKINMLTKEIEL